MLQATWDYQGHNATWQPDHTIEVYHLPSGWACRLSVKGTVAKVSFPYDTSRDAQYAAERIAQSLWGPPGRSSRNDTQ